MRKCIIIPIILVSFWACSQNVHQDPTHNFTVQRLLIVNGNNELLMCREQSVWAPPSLIYDQRQFLKEGLDSLSNAYGIRIEELQLRGKFSYKYDYHPHATSRDYFVARYVSGDLKVPKGMDEAKWVPLPQAIEKNSVTAIMEITRQIMMFPHTIWGGSFMVSRTESGHPTKIVEDFYPLFEMTTDGR